MYEIPKKKQIGFLFSSSISDLDHFFQFLGHQIASGFEKFHQIFVGFS